MGLSEQFDSDLKTALKAKDERKVSTLRMLKAALGNHAIQKGKPTLDEAEIIDVVRKEIKQHEESIAAFAKGGRNELVAKETKEAEILKSYLPPEMGEAQLRALIQETIRELGVTGPTAMGSVMKALIRKVGAQADGKKINQLVKELLG